jgi:hypothetical protein
MGAFDYTGEISEPLSEMNPLEFRQPEGVRAGREFTEANEEVKNS